MPCILGLVLSEVCGWPWPNGGMLDFGRGSVSRGEVDAWVGRPAASRTPKPGQTPPHTRFEPRPHALWLRAFSINPLIAWALTTDRHYIFTIITDGRRPNPTLGMSIFRFPTITYISKCKWIIFDSFGRVCYSSSAPSPSPFLSSVVRIRSLELVLVGN